jgi:hypothetical protein
LSRQKFYVAGYFIHFFLIATVATREFFWVLSQSRTIFSSSLNQTWRKAEEASSVALLQDPHTPSGLRQATATYLHLAGIESGYGFFAPNITGQCKLVFELHYPDGRTESAVPAVSSDASGLRVATLLDKIGWSKYDALREPIIKMFTQAAWREHRDATMIRAVLGMVVLPTIDEYENGIGSSNEFLYSYEYKFEPAAPKP